MKQHEAVIHVMRQRGGFATLAQLYAEALRVPGSHWGTKTPQESIRRIVQTHPAFFRIRPGLWGLAEMRQEIAGRLSLSPEAMRPTRTETEFDHTYYQGLAVELGNFGGLQTVVPNQDRKKRFLDRPLGDVCSLRECHPFSYGRLVSMAKAVDVVWFNERRLPSAFIEVEFTTDFSRALEKFCEFQDFRAALVVVADHHRRRQYDHKVGLTAYRPIRGLVRFVDFEQLANEHARMARAGSGLVRAGPDT